ncbi:DUF1365 domain-containing protein [Vibrio gallaecicus]|uniref:DUF1365 domain-containing protein n=1 Tax=Vibrio gallaecicus TaxID=552386 RepID=UPI0010CA12E2|nr:DUF1365 domain-containing protein [Vibrio gallaecicus]MDN3616157.1 DUF1365 domain-containing protein [Vibrio gallaecicus]
MKTNSAHSSSTHSDSARSEDEFSGIYWGNVRHRRFGEITHKFSYQLFMMGIDLDELAKTSSRSLVFGLRWFNPIRFVESDYIRNEPGNLKDRISDKVKLLGGTWDTSNRVTMLVQCRCLGLYFSPINCYFCYDSAGKCQYMLAEVSNTPWRQRHYYLIDMAKEMKVKKDFHVSPFMDLNMMYHWKIKPPAHSTLVHIENRKPNDQNIERKVFDATLALSKRPISSQSLWNTLLSIPAMTFKIVFGIYYQALKLFIKKVPFVAHPETKSEPSQR